MSTNVGTCLNLPPAPGALSTGRLPISWLDPLVPQMTVIGASSLLPGARAKVSSPPHSCRLRRNVRASALRSVICRSHGGRPARAIVKGFGCRPVVTYPPAMGPASESLRGRNPRAVCVYGDLIEQQPRRGMAALASLRVDCRRSSRIGRRCCTRRHDSTTIGGIASALAGTGATVVRRREQHVTAGGWCNEAVTVVMTLRSQPRHRAMAGLGVRHRARRSRRRSCGRRNRGMAADAPPQYRWCQHRRALLASPPMASVRRSIPWHGQCRPCRRQWRAARSGGCDGTPWAGRGAGSA